MIVFPASLITSAPISLLNARIGYQTYSFDLTPDAVSASSETPDGPKDAPLRPDTAEFWQPVTLPATWVLDLGAIQTLDYVAIAAHTIGSNGVTVRADTDLLPTPSFSALFADLGAGAADLTLLRGTGSATFTRATVAWTKLSTGLWAQVGSGVARSCYLGMNTAVGAYGGYRSESARTQLVTPTASIRDMTDASWVKTTMTAAKTATGIDGAANSASTLTATAGNATALQTLVAAATSRTYSCWVKRRTGTGNIELTQDGATFTNIAPSINSATYTLVQLNATQLNASFGIRVVTNGDAVDVDFNQFEAGTFASTPIDNTGTRNADVLTYPNAANMSGSVGSCYAEVTAPVTALVLSFVGTSTTGRLLEAAASDQIRVIDSAGNFAVKSGLAAYTQTTPVKRASSWSVAGGMSVTGDGAAVAKQATFVSMDTGNPIGIGCFGTGSNQTFGTIKNVHLWTSQLTDAQLVSITTATASQFDPPWVVLSTELTPTDDAPIWFLDTPRTSRYVRLALSGAGSVMPRMAVVFAGVALAMQQELEGSGFVPPNLSRRTVMNNSLSRGGQFLGQGFRRNGVTGSMHFKLLQSAWYRANFDPFVLHARRYPYFVAWSPQNFQTDVAFVSTEKDIVPSYMGGKDFMQVSWAMQGIG